MTERHRTALLTACAFARGFLKAADAEAQGGPSLPRQEAQDELEAALRRLADLAAFQRSLDPVYNPDINRPSTQPYPHIDSDRTVGPSDWDRECQESGRLNR